MDSVRFTLPHGQGELLFITNENKKEFIYYGTDNVVLKSLNNSSSLGKAFFNEVN